jgi:hypothetical protein
MMIIQDEKPASIVIVDHLNHEWQITDTGGGLEIHLTGVSALTDNLAVLAASFNTIKIIPIVAPGRALAGSVAGRVP